MIDVSDATKISDAFKSELTYIHTDASKQMLHTK